MRLTCTSNRLAGLTTRPVLRWISAARRCLLNLLHAVTRYQAILARPDADWQPRTVIFAGKAASSYSAAKNIIRLIHDVGQVINHDPRIGDKLKVVFIPNYGVSVAEKAPAAMLSSTALSWASSS